MKSLLAEINRNAAYKVDEIVKLKLILNTQGKPDRDYIYRLIRDRRLIAIYVIGVKRKLLRVPGHAIIHFLKQSNV